MGDAANSGENGLLGLRDKATLVVGGGQGIGRSCALHFARAGAHVAVLDLDAARARAVAFEVEALGQRGEPVAADVTDAESAARGVENAARALGRLDVLVNIVGLASWSPLLELDEETWDRDMLLNLKQHHFIAQPAARLMVQQGEGGAMAMIASVSGLLSAPNHAAYGAAKAGLVALARSMAEEWAEHGIRVNTVVPGSVRTPRMVAMQEAGEAPTQQDGLDRMAECDDVAGAVLFLCSELSRKVTGQALVVDGGTTTLFPFKVA